MSIPKNTVYALLGLNGSGKSTILKTICGILQPTSEVIQINNHKSSFIYEKGIPHKER